MRVVSWFSFWCFIFLNCLPVFRERESFCALVRWPILIFPNTPRRKKYNYLFYALLQSIGSTNRKVFGSVSASASVGGTRMSALLAEFPSPLTDKESFLLSSRYLSFSSFYWNVMWSCFIIPAECHKLHACWTDWRWRRVPIQSHWHHRWALITLHCNE